MGLHHTSGDNIYRLGAATLHLKFDRRFSVSRIFVGTVLTLSVFATHLAGQRGTAMPGGAGMHMGGGRIPGGAGNFFDRNSGLNRFGRFGASRFGFPGFNSLGYPGYYSDYYPDAGYPTDDYGYQPQPNFVVVTPQIQAPEPPLPPPPPAQPVIREYHWPDAGSTPSATFSLVSKDGVVRLALAVWAQDNELRFTALDGASGRLSLDAVDRDATARLNAEKHLTLRLPPHR